MDENLNLSLTPPPPPQYNDEDFIIKMSSNFECKGEMKSSDFNFWKTVFLRILSKSYIDGDDVFELLVTGSLVCRDWRIILYGTICGDLQISSYRWAKKFKLALDSKSPPKLVHYVTKLQILNVNPLEFITSSQSNYNSNKLSLKSGNSSRDPVCYLLSSVRSVCLNLKKLSIINSDKLIDDNSVLVFSNVANINSNEDNILQKVWEIDDLRIINAPNLSSKGLSCFLTAIFKRNGPSNLVLDSVMGIEINHQSFEWYGKSNKWWDMHTTCRHLCVAHDNRDNSCQQVILKELLKMNLENKSTNEIISGKEEIKDFEKSSNISLKKIQSQIESLSFAGTKYAGNIITKLICSPNCNFSALRLLDISNVRFDNYNNDNLKHQLEILQKVKNNTNNHDFVDDAVFKNQILFMKSIHTLLIPWLSPANSAETIFNLLILSQKYYKCLEFLTISYNEQSGTLLIKPDKIREAAPKLRVLRICLENESYGLPLSVAYELIGLTPKIHFSKNNDYNLRSSPVSPRIIIEHFRHDCIISGSYFEEYLNIKSCNEINELVKGKCYISITNKDITKRWWPE